MTISEEKFTSAFDSLARIGRHANNGGYRRTAWSPADIGAREWFRNEAHRLGLGVEVDRNGNLWAWWGEPRLGAIGTGSHLDTVVDGGAFDGALGVVSAFVAIEALQDTYPLPRTPVVVAAFVEEEGARFGLPTLGSRLSIGQILPNELANLEDRGGVRYLDAMSEAGVDPATMGPDLERLSALAAFIELHIEQGRGLVDLGLPVGVLSGVWPHGRWRLEMSGAADHAGSAEIGSRADPMLAMAGAVQSARIRSAALDARATIGRVAVEPNTTNTVPGRVTAWLDARAPSEPILEALVAAWQKDVEQAAGEHGVTLKLERESFTPLVHFDVDLRAAIAGSLFRIGIDPTELATAAGHDAAILAPIVPSAMLHVRNPTGISHSPAEHATVADCVSGVEAMAAVIEDLACR